MLLFFFSLFLFFLQRNWNVKLSTEHYVYDYTLYEYICIIYIYMYMYIYIYIYMYIRIKKEKIHEALKVATRSYLWISVIFQSFFAWFDGREKKRVLSLFGNIAGAYSGTTFVRGFIFSLWLNESSAYASPIKCRHFRGFRAPQRPNLVDSVGWVFPCPPAVVRPFFFHLPRKVIVRITRRP